MARIPQWDWAVATASRRWAGHLGRFGHREPSRWFAVVAAWIDSWWRHTMRGLHDTDADPGPSRPSRGHRALGQRRCDETFQTGVMTETRQEVPWQAITDNRALWNDLE